MESQEFVAELIYDLDGKIDPPHAMLDLYHRIQTLTYLYKEHPEWPEKLKDDVKDYVQQCIDLLIRV